MKKTITAVFTVLAVFSGLIMGSVAYCDRSVSDSYTVRDGEDLELCFNTVVGVAKENGEKAELKLFGIIPIKSVNVTVSGNEEVEVLGKPFGIKIYSDGVMVVAVNDVETENGNVSPAREAGISVGDIITEVNGKEVLTNSEIVEIISESGGKTVNFRIKHNENVKEVEISPVKSLNDGKYKVGIWVRDSAAGIGTLTFYSEKDDVLAGLGHGICDVDTGELITVGSGQMTEASVIGIKKATDLVTGELRGMLSANVMAKIVKNDVTGVYGSTGKNAVRGVRTGVALKQEVKTGQAELLATVDGTEPKRYSCKIVKIYHNDTSLIKNMLVKITDDELLESTGGIAQGMSGSPIVQNGKLVGAVTHVLVDDPTTGYAIFAENMLETAQSVANKNILKEAS